MKNWERIWRIVECLFAAVLIHLRPSLPPSLPFHLPLSIPVSVPCGIPTRQPDWVSAVAGVGEGLESFVTGCYDGCLRVYGPGCKVSVVALPH